MSKELVQKNNCLFCGKLTTRKDYCKKCFNEKIIIKCYCCGKNLEKTIDAFLKTGSFCKKCLNIKYRESIYTFKCKDCGKPIEKGTHCSKCKKNIENLICPICKKNFKKSRISIEKTGLICQGCNTKSSNLKKYGFTNVMSVSSVKEKHKNTCLKKYGCENVFQNEEIKEKIRNYNIKNHGVDNYAKTKECREKMEKTCIELYGVHSYNKTNEFKNKVKATCLKNYGVDNPAKLETSKEKVKNTCLEKYGQEYPIKDKNYGYNYNNNYFDSSWELAFWIFCEDKGLKIERNKKGFPYKINNKEHLFFPDFLIKDNILIEIKGNHLIKGPWDNVNEKTIEKFKICEKENILIISKEEIQPYLNYVNSSYGTYFLKKFKIN